MKQKNKVLKWGGIILNTIFYLFILVLILFSFANMGRKTQDSIPNLFGFGYMNVLTESMSGENPDSLNKGDLVWVKTVTSKNSENLKVGQVICFWDPTQSILISHRIVEIVEDQNGEVTYITRGDLQEFKPGGMPYDPTDPFADIRDSQGNVPPGVSPTFETVHHSNVRAVVINITRGAGSTLAYLSDPFGGFFIWIVLPAVAFLAYELVILIRSIMGLQKEKLKTVAEDDKEKLRQELLEQIRKEEMQKLLDAQKEASKEEASKESTEESK